MLRLTSNKIIVTPVFDPRRSPGGIIIPDVAVERCDQGIVKYIGPKVRELKPGDYVLFSGYDGTTIRLEGEGDLILMREDNCKCIIGDIGTEVEGLYFKAKPTQDYRERFRVKLAELMDCGSINCEVTPELVLSARDALLQIVSEWVNDLYFPATYEQAINLCSQAMTEHAVTHKNFNMDRSNPIVEIDEDEL